MTDPTTIPAEQGAAAQPDRRAVLTACGGGCLALATTLALAACGGSDSSSSSSSSGAAGASSSGGGVPQPALAKLADIPVGGALAVNDGSGAPIILARPSADKVVGFSAHCTHQGTPVQVAGKLLICPRHGSQFDALTGAVKPGFPAKSNLQPWGVKIEGTEVVATNS